MPALTRMLVSISAHRHPPFHSLAAPTDVAHGDESETGSWALVCGRLYSVYGISMRRTGSTHIKGCKIATPPTSLALPLFKVRFCLVRPALPYRQNHSHAPQSQRPVQAGLSNLSEWRRRCSAYVPPFGDGWEVRNGAQVRAPPSPFAGELGSPFGTQRRLVCCLFIQRPGYLYCRRH